MLESINHVINQNSAQQIAAENSAAHAISNRLTRNQQAIKRHMPTLTKVLQHNPVQYELIVNANKTLNICLKAAGVVLYGPEPEQEIEIEVKTFLQHLTLRKPATKNALVITGVGLGYHLLALVQHINPSYLLIYEPDVDLLALSFKSAAWFELLTLCSAENILLFIQYGDAAEQLTADINELTNAFADINNIIFYQHMCYPSLAESIYYQHHGQQNKQCAASPLFLPRSFYTAPHDIQPFCANSTQQLCFKHNMQWLAAHTPDLYKQLTQQKWQQWQLVQHGATYAMQDKCGRVYSTHYNKARYGTPPCSPALLDPVVFDYSLPTKLLHSDFAKLFGGVKALQQQLLAKPQQETNFTFREKLLLGTADVQACQQALASSQYLLVQETEPDFLFASLYFVPWYQFSGQLHFCQTSMDMASRLQQLYQQNILQLTDISIVQPYYEQELQRSYHKLLELIQACNGKANYFEKQLSSLQHLYVNKTSARYLGMTDLSVDAPLFIAGNGPSLEQHISFLQQHRQQLILVSCGTALITLQRQGLTPDYHLELERGADTLYFLEQLPAEYLTQITLIAPADQHPSVIKVFAQAWLVLTQDCAINKVFADSLTGIEIRRLKHSYYTVTNFAVDLFLTIKCSNIYLLGVDFGFKHINAHHANGSIYFNKDGSELYDFEYTHGAAYQVEANFGGTCFTVPPFDVARKLMGERILLSPKQQVYNCNDGAYINGCIALKQLTAQQTSTHVEQAKLAFEKLFITINQQCNQTPTPQSLLQSTANLITILINCCNKYGHDNFKQALKQQRMQLDAELQQPQPLSYILLDGAMRYMEMISARVLTDIAGENCKAQLAQLWLKYLQQSLVRCQQCITEFIASNQVD